MTEYDPKIIQEFADILYDKADSVVKVAIALGALIGGAFDATLGSGVRIGDFPPILGIIIGAGIGYFNGKGRAFLYKLQAQNALCQVQTEENTRKKED